MDWEGGREVVDFVGSICGGVGGGLGMMGSLLYITHT